MKYALITGGSGGIGKAICLKLSQMGYPVIIHYNKNVSAAQALKTEIEEKGDKAELVSFDVTNSDEVTTAL